MKKVLTVIALSVIGLVFGIPKDDSSPVINTASADVPGEGGPDPGDGCGSDTGSCCDSGEDGSGGGE